MTTGIHVPGPLVIKISRSLNFNNIINVWSVAFMVVNIDDK